MPRLAVNVLPDAENKSFAIGLQDTNFLHTDADDAIWPVTFEKAMSEEVSTMESSADKLICKIGTDLPLGLLWQSEKGGLVKCPCPSKCCSTLAGLASVECVFAKGNNEVDQTSGQTSASSRRKEASACLLTAVGKS